jgi:hypothetical protein
MKIFAVQSSKGFLQFKANKGEVEERLKLQLIGLIRMLCCSIISIFLHQVLNLLEQRQRELFEQTSWRSVPLLVILRMDFSQKYLIKRHETQKNENSNVSTGF